MVRAVGHVADQFRFIIDEDGSDQGHVGEMRTTDGRMIGDDGIARLHHDLLANHSNTEAEGSQVHRNVRRARDEGAFSIEKGAGEIRSLLHVGRNGRALQQRPHLLDEVVETMPEEFVFDLLGTMGFLPRCGRHPVKDEAAVFGQGRIPALPEKQGAEGVLDHGGTVNSRSFGQRRPVEERIGAGLCHRWIRGLDRVGGNRCVALFSARACDGPVAHQFDRAIRRRGIPEGGFIPLREGGGDLGWRLHLEGQGGVLAPEPCFDEAARDDAGEPGLLE